MSAWLESALAKADAKTASALDSVNAIKQAAREQLHNTAWPTRKTEAWKYTSLYALSEQNFKQATLVPAKQANSSIEGITSLDIAFDGAAWQFDKEQLSSVSGLNITLLNDSDILPQGFATIKPAHHLFGRLNDALFDDALLITVDEGVSVKPVIRLLVSNSDQLEQHVRIFVSVAENAEVTVLEQVEGTASSLTNSTAEYDIAAHAKLNHYRLQLQTEQSFCVGGDFFRLAEKAELNSHIVGFGSTLSRLDVDIEHAGEHTFAKMNAIYLLDGEEHFDLHSTIEHAVPNGTTDENVRGIVADRAQAVFNGRIHIHRDAQKTLAELNNRNLLLSRRAEINTKPELEIYADDVRCAHGATVAEIDSGALYYLTSRGISRADALVMLNFGFVNELVDQMPDESVADFMREKLHQRFSQMKPE